MLQLSMIRLLDYGVIFGKLFWGSHNMQTIIKATQNKVAVE